MSAKHHRQEQDATEEEENAGEEKEKDDEQQRQLKQQQAYQQFMLQRQSTSKKKSKGTTEKPPPSPNTPGERGHSSAQQQQQQQNYQQQQQQQQQYQRKLASIVKAFSGTLQRDWLEVDETLGNVMSSIAHLRHRISLEQRQVLQMERANQYDNKVDVPQDDDDGNYDDCDDWKTWGFHARGRNAGVALTRADIHMALSRDLLQHESMCSTARRLLASLAQTQDALGRRLDEMMQWEMNCDVSVAESNKCATVVASCQQVYSNLALELYRKQSMVHQVLESVHNGMLWTDVRKEEEDLFVAGTVGAEEIFGESRIVEESKSHPSNEEIPMQVADGCVKEWPLTRQSYWNVSMWEQVRDWQ